MSPLEILYEDNHLIAVNKRVSDIVQGDKTGDIPLKDIVAQYLKQKYNKPGNVFVGVTHRIDRPVTGVVLFARTSKALTRLNKLFGEKDSLEKTYWAIVKNTPPANQGRLVDFLRKDESKNKSFICDKSHKEAKEAILDYQVIASSDRYHLLKVTLITGRHHQIRAQLANLGCPIKGDLKYGFPRSNPDAGISLHARELKLLHPVSQQWIDIIAPVPDEKLWKYFESII